MLCLEDRNMINMLLHCCNLVDVGSTIFGKASTLGTLPTSFTPHPRCSRTLRHDFQPDLQEPSKRFIHVRAPWLDMALEDEGRSGEDHLRDFPGDPWFGAPSDQQYLLFGVASWKMLNGKSYPHFTWWTTFIQDTGPILSFSPSSMPIYPTIYTYPPLLQCMHIYEQYGRSPQL